MPGAQAVQHLSSLNKSILLIGAMGLQAGPSLAVTEVSPLGALAWVVYTGTPRGRPLWTKLLQGILGGRMEAPNGPGQLALAKTLSTCQLKFR